MNNGLQTRHRYLGKQARTCLSHALSAVEDWPAAERLSEEFTAVGFYLTGHPLEDYMPSLKRQGVLTLEQVDRRVKDGPFRAKIAGTIAGYKERKSAKGNRYAFVQLSDTTGGYEITLFADSLTAARDHLEEGAHVIFTADATLEADQLKATGPICRAH